MKAAVTSILAYAAALTASAQPTRSLVHYQNAEAAFLQNDMLSASNEFRAALAGDLEPKWTEAWAHIGLGEIYLMNGQRDRAANEFKQALRTNDNTFGAQDEAMRLLTELRVEIPARLRPAHLRPRAKPATSVPAEYSGEARIAELEGTLLLEGVIGDDGRAGDLAVIEPLGLGLDENAMSAVRTWSFSPAEPGMKPAPHSSAIAVDFLLPSKLSRWHLVGVTFAAPQGASRPEFMSTVYPPGAGIDITGEIADRGSILATFGRPAAVTIGFDIDETGHPENPKVQGDADTKWADQAMAFVRDWRFKPGSKDGRLLRVHCSIDLMWGPQKLTAEMIERYGHR